MDPDMDNQAQLQAFKLEASGSYPEIVLGP